MSLIISFYSNILYTFNIKSTKISYSRTNKGRIEIILINYINKYYINKLLYYEKVIKILNILL